MSRNLKFFVVLALGTALFGGIAHAQVITGTILGKVTAAGAPLPGVTIILKNTDVGQTRTLLTDDGGNYRAPALTLGNYEVRAELAGFQPKIRTGIRLTVGREAVVNFTLGMAEISEAIVVQGEAPAVNVTESTIGYLVDEQKVRDLPLNGRDLTSLTLLQPGVILSRASANSSNVGRGLKISVAGSRPNQNLFTLDGTDYNDALNNTPGSAQGLLTGVETIKEFQVLTNTMSAEYGRSAGGVFNAVTKSGTNEFHGSVFEFHRDDNLDSKNFFDQEKPAFRRNQFGGSLGGPIARDRTFFFGSYEGLREFKEITTVATVPDDDARNGILPSGPVTINAAVRPYLDLYPRANGARILDSKGVATGLAEFRGVNPRDSYQNYGMARIDHSFNESDTAFLRYIFEDSELDEPIVFPAFPNIVRNKKHVVTAEERHLFSSATLNEFRVGFNSSKPAEDVNPLDPHTEIAFVTGKAFGEISVTGLTEIGTDRTNPKSFFSDAYQVTDNFSVIRGNHALKMGGNFERFSYDGNSESRTRGRLRFRTLSDFLKGTTRDFELAKPGSDFQRNYRQNLFGAYVQDDYRFGTRLTVNAGLRWEFVTSPSEENGKISNLRSINDSQVTVGGDLFKTSKNNIAPRLGFAWDIFGDGKTALRGGVGRFYDLPLFAQWRNPIFRSLPFVDRARVNRPTLPIDPSKVTVSGPSDTESFVYDLDPTYVTQYNVNIQRDLGWLDTVVSVGYVGSRGHNLLGQGDVNIAVPQIRADGSQFFPSGSARRNPNFGTVRSIMQGFRSEYNGAHLSIQKRKTHNLQAQLSYTYGESNDNRSGSGGRQEYANGQARTFDPYDFDADWGRSDFDIRHNAVFNASYDVPLGKGRFLEGWQVNVIGTYAGGVPFSPIIPGDPDRDGSEDNAARPNVVPGCNPSDVPGGRNDQHWFNPLCFSFPELGTRGNAKRNSLEGPDYRTVDLGIVKNTPITNGFNAQVRFEVFNVFNRANFDIPANNPDGEAIFDDAGNRLADAGKIFRTITDGRSFQLAVRLFF